MASKVIKNNNKIIIVKNKRNKICFDLLNSIKQMESKIDLVTYINTPRR